MDSSVIVPLVVAIVAAGPAYLGVRKTNKHLGSSNGFGPVTKMLESTLVQLGELRSEVKQIGTRADQHALDQGIHNRAAAAHNRGQGAE